MVKVYILFSERRLCSVVLGVFSSRERAMAYVKLLPAGPDEDYKVVEMVLDELMEDANV